MISGLTHALGPFALKSFRFQWPADLLTSWAGEMEGIILSWYVIVETGSVLVLTIYGSLQYLGTLLSPLFGVLGDRIGHRNLLCIMRAGYCLFATTTMTLAFTGIIRPGYVLIVAACMGLVRSSDLVMRNALVGASMPPAVLVSAASVMRTTMDSARIAGSLTGAGLIAVLGMGNAYIAIAVLYATSFCLTLGVYRSPKRDVPRAFTPLRDLGEGFRYVWNTPAAVSAMALAVLVNLTAFPMSQGLLRRLTRAQLRRSLLGHGAADGRLDADLVRAAGRLPAPAKSESRHGRAYDRRFRAKPRHGADVGDPIAHRGGSPARPRHGRAHACGLRAADRPPRRRRADPAARLCTDGRALLLVRYRVGGAHRAALAQPALGRRAGPGALTPVGAAISPRARAHRHARRSRQ
jgi:Major Facilitator Superfamily